MTKEMTRNLRLGAFVLAGTLFLITLLYLMGEKKSLFGSTFRLHAEFHNVNGLMEGNNVRFAGINVGTVETVEIVSDSSIRVSMLVEDRVQRFIKKDAVASIGTDGLMGNKLVSINSVPNSTLTSVEDDDKLNTLRPLETDEMFRTLNTTNDNIKFISSDLRNITHKINSPNTLWSLLMDTVVAQNVKEAIVNIKLTGSHSAIISGDLREVAQQMRSGKGLVASLITDTTLSGRLEGTLVKLDQVGDRMALVSGDLEKISGHINKGEGTIGMLVVDTVFARNLKSAVQNADSGAFGFKENMEALQHNIFLRKYFKNKNKPKK